MVRPEYPVTSKAVETLEGSREICYPCDPVVRKWSTEVSKGSLKRPRGEKPKFWLTPDDMKLLIKIPRQDCDELQKTVVVVFLTGMDLLRRCSERESLMNNVYLFTHMNLMTAAKSLSLKCPEQLLPTPTSGNTFLPEHGIVATADQEF